MEKHTKSKGALIWSWALYDWANSAFATTVMAGFFPIFFKKYWSGEFSATESTYVLGVTNSVASFLLAFSSPALGAIADQGAWRRKFLLFFTLLGALASVWLGLIGPGDWLTASLVYSLGMVGFTGGVTFYDALLVEVAEPNDYDRVSGLGYGLGYLGGGLLFAVNVAMFLKPGLFGLADPPAAVKWSFVSVGAWWLLFSLPLFLFVKETPPKSRGPLLAVVKSGFTGLIGHIGKMRRNRVLLFFLAGFLFYNDAVNTIIKMAVDYGIAIGLEQGDLIKALLMVQFIGFPAAIAFGYLGESIGPLRGIFACLLTYLGVTVYAYYVSDTLEFFVLAGVIGVVQGGIQALSRSYFARLVKPEEAAEYFGFFNMIGKFSSIFGPFLVGWVGWRTGNPRAGILVLTLFFIAGGLLLARSHRLARRPGEGSPA